MAVALTAALWSTVQHLHPTVARLDATLATLALLAVPAWVAAMTLRLLLAGGYRVVSGWAIGISAMLGTVAALHTLLFAPAEDLTTVGAGLWAAAVVGLVIPPRIRAPCGCPNRRGTWGGPGWSAGLRCPEWR